MSRLRKFLHGRSLAFAGVVLVLPKCVLCVAPYLALGTAPELCGATEPSTAFGPTWFGLLAAVGLGCAVHRCVARPSRESEIRTSVR